MLILVIKVLENFSKNLLSPISIAGKIARISKGSIHGMGCNWRCQKIGKKLFWQNKIQNHFDFKIKLIIY
jgi:hypothetical protein